MFLDWCYIQLLQFNQACGLGLPICALGVLRW